MPYSEFTIDAVKARFGLTITDAPGTFAGSPAVAPGALLTETLAETLPLAVAVSTEKARSEFVVAPVLLEARRRAGRPVSLFSGVDFPVDAAQGLTGVCDFLLSLSPDQLTVEAPAVAVVEAKNDNLKAGLGQCIAEMVAARLFNERRGRGLPRVYGVVTTGSLWKFLALEGDAVHLDPAEYHVADLARVVGVLVGMLKPPGGNGRVLNSDPLWLKSFRLSHSALPAKMPAVHYASLMVPPAASAGYSFNRHRVSRTRHASWAFGSWFTKESR